MYQTTFYPRYYTFLGIRIIPCDPWRKNHGGKYIDGPNTETADVLCHRFLMGIEYKSMQGLELMPPVAFYICQY